MPDEIAQLKQQLGLRPAAEMGEGGEGRIGVPLANRQAGERPAATVWPTLQGGQLHEWFWVDETLSSRRGDSWHAPLTLLTQLAGQTGPGSGKIVCVGPTCWPAFQLCPASTPAPLRRWLFLDPLSAAERFWAIGQ